MIRFSLVIMGGLLVPALLQAHAKLGKTQPASGATVSTPPSAIQLSFDEEVDLKVSKIFLTGPSGAVAVGATQAPNAKTLMSAISSKLADGTYTVTWQTAAADDGHVSKGNFRFNVKQAH
jgi:methionine-rich copper-binding protein CopC